MATNRLSLMDDGRLRYDLKRPWSDGTTAVAFTPMEFVERLMALVPQPLKNTIRYHGVFAPRHRWRSRVVRDRASIRAELEAQREEEMRESVWERLLAMPPQFPETSIELPSPNWRWSELMRHSFGIELLTCDNCGGKRKVISTLSWGPVVDKFLACIRVKPVESEARPARPPPEQMAWGW